MQMKQKWNLQLGMLGGCDEIMKKKKKLNKMKLQAEIKTNKFVSKKKQKKTEQNMIECDPF